MKFPVPNAGESREVFVGRLINDEGMKTAYPVDADRLAVCHAFYTRPVSSVENAADIESWPMVCKCKHIEPGLVNYSDLGTVLVTKETLDKMAPSFIGKPVINEIHKEVDPSVFKNGVADGIVTDHWFEPSDGWYWARFVVWDETTKRNIASEAYSVSCAYDVLGVNEKGGLHNNVPFVGEFVEGAYTHLAIVRNPRYEGARIVILNSKAQGGGMKFKFWNPFKKDGKEVKNIGETDAGAQTVLVDGQPVPLQVLIDTFKAEEVEKAKAAELAAKAPPPAVPAATPPAPEAAGAISEETMIEIDGKETPIKNMCDSYRNAMSKKAKNDADEAAKKKSDEDKAEAEAKNAEEEKAKKEKEDAEKKVAENSKVDADLKAAAARRGAPQQPTIVSRREQVAEGARKYGSAQK